MVSYPIDFPTQLTVNSMRLFPRNAVSRSESPFSYAEQVYDWQGEVWDIEGTLPLIATRDMSETYQTFVIKLKGRRGTFLFPLPSHIGTARGTWAGTPVVNGASQTGDTLDIKGLTAGVTGIIKAGDYFNLGSGANLRLYKILDDADSNGSGLTTVNIWPSLRSSPADEAEVTFTDVKILLRMKEEIPIDIDENKHYFINFSAREALNGS